MMVKVAIRLIGNLATLANQREFIFNLQSPTLSDALIVLDKTTCGRITNQLYQNLKPEKLNESNLFVINGLEARFRDGLQTKLNDGATVSIIPPIVGG